MFSKASNPEVTTQSHGELAVAARPWVNLWITIHLFSLCVCLAANLAPSELERRVMNTLAPYTVAMHQDYGAVPLEMTRGDGIELDWNHTFELHDVDAQAEQWRPLEPPMHVLSWADRRWAAFERMIAVAANEKNDPVIHLLMERAIDADRRESGILADAVRLVQHKALSYTADLALSRGELPESDRQDRVLFHCKVVELGKGRRRLMPIAESLRTSKSLAIPERLREPESRP